MPCSMYLQDCEARVPAYSSLSLGVDFLDLAGLLASISQSCQLHDAQHLRACRSGHRHVLNAISPLRGWVQETTRLGFMQRAHQ